MRVPVGSSELELPRDACPAAPVTRRGASRAVGVCFRVSRPWVAAALVPRLRPRPWPLDPVLAVFPRNASRLEIEPVRSPPALAPLLQSARTWRSASPRSSDALPARPRPCEGGRLLQAPLSRFFLPFSASKWRRPLLPDPKVGSRARRPDRPRPCLSRCVPSSPFSRPRRLAPPSTPARVSPSGTRGVGSPSRVFPIPEGTAVTSAAFPS